MSETSLTHMYFFILHLKLKNKKKRREILQTNKTKFYWPQVRQLLKVTPAIKYE